MKVADLAAELEVPTSMILDQCQRFGIDAAWAGAELAGSDVVVLRAELAATDPIDLRPADPADAAGSTPPDSAPDTAAPPTPPAVPEEGTPLPPTAAGSMPELLDDLAADPDASPGEPSPSSRAPGFVMAGDQGADPAATQRVLPRPAPTKRRLEQAVRNSLGALVVAVIAFAASNFTEIAALVVVLWFVAMVALCVAVVDGFRGRRRVQTHPERLSGVWLSTISIVLAIAGIIGLTASVMGAVGDDPAVDAPLGVGKLESVQTARWGYQRVRRFEDNGWHQPARDQGTCWEVDLKKQRDEDRVEDPEHSELVSCKMKHTLEVAKVFAFNRDADAPYPTQAQFVSVTKTECGAMHDRLVKKGEKVDLRVEVPTEIGWGNGDHDVACVLVTDVRTKPLT